MRKTQIFKDMHLSTDGMKQLDAHLAGPGGIFEEPHYKEMMLVSADDAKWDFEESEDFLAEYRPGLFATYSRSRPHAGVEVRIVNYTDGKDLYSKFVVQAPDKAAIQAIFDIIENCRAQHGMYLVRPRAKKSACRTHNHKGHKGTQRK